MPQKKAVEKKAEDKTPAPRVSTSRVKTSGPVVMESAAATSAPAKSKPAAKASRARKTANGATNSLLKLNGAVNGHLTSEQIAERAYFLWIEKGCPQGTADQDWIEAERELSAD